MLITLCLFLAWILPVQAGRHSGDLLQLVNWAADQYLDEGNRRYADSSGVYGRRYPPRQTERYDDRERDEQRYSDGRDYNGARSSGRYNDYEPATERRRYNDDKQPAYSSEPRGNRRLSNTGSGKRPDTSLDDAISRVRRKSDGRVLSAETVRNKNREEHRVRIITDDGRVRRYRLDAETGDVLPRSR